MLFGGYFLWGKVPWGAHWGVAPYGWFFCPV